ncbi:MAG TPA: penicillin-binding protein 2 [bacterium]|nr:penicillin-binding protein 2 [bacterium]
MPIDLGEDASLLRRLRRKSGLVFIAFVIFSTLIAARLWFLQVVKADYYEELSEQNRIRIVVDEALRGLILDREGRQLVGNRPSFDVLVDSVRRAALDSLKAFSRMAGIPEHNIVQVSRGKMRGHTVRAVQDVSFKALSVLEEHRVDLPGLEVAIRPKRRFIDPTLACHLVGYLGEATKAEIERSGGRIKLGDKMGRSGIELFMDECLRGSDGRRLVETNAMGRILRTLKRAEVPVAGSNVVLTLDLELQSAIEKLFDAKKGAVVVMNPRTGGILAMVSRPAFDLAAFECQISPDDWQKLRDDPDAPMNNRCVAGQYPPGSTFKVFVGLAALQSQAITTDDQFECTGVMKLGDGEFHCWKKEGHGELSISPAIVHSCNIFFYKTALACGIGPIANMAREFGFGSPTGLEVLHERGGYIPTAQDFLNYWPGDVVAASIGQGRILVTPLQMAVALCALVNGGHVLRPFVVWRTESPDGEVLKRFGPRVVGHVSVDARYIKLVRDALFGVVNRQGGTGWRARLDFPKIAGKTGTAQVVQRVDDEETILEDIPYDRRPHSWFMGYAPADEPEIAFAVLVEHGGAGGQAAAVLAKKIVAAAFREYDLEGEH